MFGSIILDDYWAVGNSVGCASWSADGKFRSTVTESGVAVSSAELLKFHNFPVATKYTNAAIANTTSITKSEFVPELESVLIILSDIIVILILNDHKMDDKILYLYFKFFI